MSLGDKEFGELIGQVKAMNGRLDSMQQANTREHDDVVNRIEQMRTDVTTRLNNHAGRIDSLEQTRDKGSGAAWAIRIGQGFVFLLVAIAAFFR